MATRIRRDRGALKDHGDWKSHYQQLWNPMAATPTTQPADGMTLAQFTTARQVLRDALSKFRDPVCHNCKSFSMGACSQFGEVPAEFQKTPEQCEAWTWDGIPF